MNELPNMPFSVGLLLSIPVTILSYWILTLFITPTSTLEVIGAGPVLALLILVISFVAVIPIAMVFRNDDTNGIEEDCDEKWSDGVQYQ